jgi:acyl-CoA synthetase (NDP forming)
MDTALYQGCGAEDMEKIYGPHANRANIMRLNRLLSPSSVAVIGASDKQGKVGQAVMESMARGNIRVYPVNPHEDTVGGKRSYASVRELPEVPDLAVIAVSAQAAVPVARECAEKGIPFIIPIAGGFAETGLEGRKLEEDLRHSIAGTDTRILGPNTMGVFVPGRGLDTFFLPIERSPRPESGHIALVSQSGSILAGLYESAEDEGVGLHACVGIGNKVDLDESDFLEHFGEEPECNCIALYLESFAHGRRFMESCRSISLHKPIVAVRVGITPRGAKAATSHTGALASSSDALVTGVFHQTGVIRVSDEREMLDAAKALANVTRVDGDRIAIVSSTGGFGVIATDYIESKEKGFGMRLAELSEETKARIREKVPSFASVNNPIDLTGAVTNKMYDQVLEIMEDEASADAILLILQFQPPGVDKGLVDVAEGWFAKGRKPLVVCCIGGSFPRPILRNFERRGIPTYTTLRRAVFALHVLSERGRYLKRHGR